MANVHEPAHGGKKSVKPIINSEHMKFTWNENERILLWWIESEKKNTVHQQVQTNMIWANFSS